MVTNEAFCEVEYEMDILDLDSREKVRLEVVEIFDGIDVELYPWFLVCKKKAVDFTQQYIFRFYRSRDDLPSSILMAYAQGDYYSGRTVTIQSGYDWRNDPYNKWEEEE